MRFFAKVLILFLWSSFAHSTEVNRNFRVEGLAPGEYVVFSSKEYSQYKCGKSDFGDLTWCRKSEKRKFMGQTVDTVTSISHRADGEVLYISYTMSDVRITQNLAMEQTGYLQQSFGTRPRILQMNTRTKTLNEGLIAYWGDIDLYPLRSEERNQIENGQPTGKGYLVDYLSSPKLSVKERLPVYAIGSGYGYIYLISSGPSGKGTISFRAMDNRAILAEISLAAGVVQAGNSELHNMFADAEKQAGRLPIGNRQALSELQLEYQNDRNVNSVQKINQYKERLDAISNIMIRDIVAQTKDSALKEKLQPLSAELKQINASVLPENLKIEHNAIIDDYNKLMTSSNLTEAQVDACLDRYHSFKMQREEAENLTQITAKVKKSTEEMEKVVDKLDNQTDRDAARTLILKAKAIGTETTYKDLVEIARELQAYDQKVNELEEFDDLSRRALELIQRIENELKSIIDDGAVVQSIREAIERTRRAIQAKDLSELKVSVGNLTSRYESSKNELKDKTFDTF